MSHPIAFEHGILANAALFSSSNYRPPINVKTTMAISAGYSQSPGLASREAKTAGTAAPGRGPV
jgi:hypothetical protein